MLANASIEAQKIRVHFATGNSVILPFYWWRDHCQCSECHHPETHQRLFDTFGLPEELDVASVRISDDHLQLTIEWSHEKHVSTFTHTFIENLRPDPATLEVKRTHWTAKTFEFVDPYVQYDNFMRLDSELRYMLEMTEQFGFCFVEGVPPDSAATTGVAQRIAYIRETIFGNYYEMTANLEHKDTAYTPLAIGPHTDSTYSFDAPSYQMFHCLEERCEGGDNVLIDGFKIAEVMKEKYPFEYQTLTQIHVPGQYIDTTRDIHLMAQRPIFRLNQRAKLVQVSYNNHDRAPFFLEPYLMQDFYRALDTFARLYSKPEFQYRRKLLPGTVLFFDNWRLLHARDAYTGYRKLASTYFNKEDVESKLRVLRTK